MNEVTGTAAIIQLVALTLFGIGVFLYLTGILNFLLGSHDDKNTNKSIAQLITGTILIVAILVMVFLLQNTAQTEQNVILSEQEIINMRTNMRITALGTMILYPFVYAGSLLIKEHIRKRKHLKDQNHSEDTKTHLNVEEDVKEGTEYE